MLEEMDLDQGNALIGHFHLARVGGNNTRGENKCKTIKRRTQDLR